MNMRIAPKNKTLYNRFSFFQFNNVTQEEFKIDDKYREIWMLSHESIIGAE